MNQAWTKALPSFIRTRIEGRHNLQKIIANTGWLFTDNLVRMGVGLVVGVWVARYLGPEQFGLLNYAMAIVGIFTPLAMLGLDRIVVRDLVREASYQREILGTTFVLKFSSGVLTFFLTLGVVFWLRSHDTLTQWLVGIIAAGTIFQASGTINLWFQSQVQSKYTVWVSNTALLLVALVKIILILWRAPLITFAWAGLVEAMLGAVGIVLVYQMNGQRLSLWQVSFLRAKELLSNSWPLILSGFAMYIQAYIDQIMLGQMLNSNEVGQYSVAMKLIGFFGFFPMIIHSSIAPTITTAKGQSEALYRKRLLDVYRLMFIMFLLTAIPIFLFSEQVVLLIYGDEYRAAGVLLSLFAIRLFFTNFGVARSLFITNENLFRYSLTTAIAGSVINVLCNYMLIPRYASIGAIWATIISYSVTTFLIDAFYPETRGNFRLMLKAMVTPLSGLKG